MKNDIAIQALVKALDKEELQFSSLQSLLTLSNHNTDSAVTSEIIKKYSKFTHSQIKCLAIDCLIALGQIEGAEALIQIASNEQEEQIVKNHVEEYLKSIKQPDIEKIVEKLKDKNSDIRRNAYLELCRLTHDNKDTALILARYVLNKNLNISDPVTECIGYTKNEIVVPILSEALKNSDLEYHAMVSLSNIVNSEMDKSITLEIIKRYDKLKNSLSRVFAVACLRKLNQKEGIEKIRNIVISDKDESVRKCAEECLIVVDKNGEKE
jgi:HEAT repeat protein